MATKQTPLIRIAVLALTVAWLAACGGAAPASQAPPPAATSAPAATTAPVATTAPAATNAPVATTAPAATSAPAATAATASAGTGSTLCGLGNGQQASGEPIMLGAVVGKTGPDDFSSSAKGAAAYFACINANGGINGRPVKYMVEDDGWNPEKAGQVASKLVKDQQVVAMVGNTSFVECAANAQLYKQENVVVIAGVGVPRECFEQANYAPTNEGPRISTIGAGQYAHDKYNAKRIVCVSTNIPNMGNWSCDGLAAWGKDKGVEVKPILIDPASLDPTSVVLDAAGWNPDAIIVTVPRGIAIPIFKAGEEQNLREKFHWLGPTSIYDISFPAAIGAYWDGAVDAQIELNATDSTGPDNQAWLKIMDTYGSKDDPRDTFSQAGFLAAKIVTDALLKLDPKSINRETVGTALRKVTGYKSDLLCGPWYFGPGDTHLANHAGRMASIKGGKWTQSADCFEVADPDVKPILELEQKEGLTK